MKFSSLIILFVFILMLSPRAAAQSKAQEKAEAQHEASGDNSVIERLSQAEPSVVVSLCLASGDVVVRGWDRGEVRARAEDAGTLRLLTPNVQPAPRVEVLVSEGKDAAPGSGECGSTSGMELMVPRGASVTLQVREGHVEVSDIAEVRVEALSGDVGVRRVSKSVEVSCLNGDISLADSSGPTRLRTISGSVEVLNVHTVSAGDDFEAKSTSGDVTLEGISHTQVTSSAVSGNLIYTGALARGGVYDFKTISGDVTLELPADSSFSLHAKVVVNGDVVTDFPIKTAAGTPAIPSSNVSASRPAPPAVGSTASLPDLAGVPAPPNGKKVVKVKPPGETVQTRLDGMVGTGDAVVNLTSFSGSLHLRKQ
jgi:hypothetical protein